VKKKMAIPIILASIVTVFLLFYYPVQRSLALQKFDEYIELQGVDKDNIESKEVVKNYKQGGYLIRVNYKDDPEFQYRYQYYPFTNRKNEDLKFHRMEGTVLNLERGYVLDPPYLDFVKYPPFEGYR